MSQLSLVTLDDEAGSTRRTKHERLREQLLVEMKEGRLKPGTLLPSEQNIAESLGVARNTVRQAMASLEQDGFIQRIHGKGTFVHEHVSEKFRSQSTGLFAVIVPETQGGFYPHLIKSFIAAAEGIHHQVIVCDTGNQVDRQGNTILQLIDREVAGVAMVPTTSPPTPDYQIRQLQRHGIPIVFCSRRVEGTRAPLLALPFEQIGYRAGEAILKAGHQDIALFFAHQSDATQGYETGFRNAIEKFGNPRSVSLNVFYTGGLSPDVETHEAKIDEILERMIYRAKNPATAIFSGFDSFTEQLYLKLTHAGYRVPEQISLLSFGASQRSTAIMKQLAAVTIDEVSMGRQALEYLDRMRRKELPIECDETSYAAVSLHAGRSLAGPGDRNRQSTRR